LQGAHKQLEISKEILSAKPFKSGRIMEHLTVKPQESKLNDLHLRSKSINPDPSKELRIKVDSLDLRTQLQKLPLSIANAPKFLN
jgi:hypothetical protein